MILLTGYILGNFTAATVCYLKPKVYESSGVFTEWASPDQSTPLSRAHAATVVSELRLDQRWELTFEESVTRLIEGVSIDSTASTTVITARLQSVHDAREIVKRLMDNFPGIERERRWAEVEGQDGHFTKKDSENLRLVQKLRSVIFETLEASGNHIPGSLISSETVERLGNEDLRRQFKAYQKAATPAGRFGPPDGNILVPPPIAAAPGFPKDPISPDIDSYFLVGRISGLVTACLVLLFIKLRRPELIEVPLPKPARLPAWADLKSSTPPDHSNW